MVDLACGSNNTKKEQPASLVLFEAGFVRTVQQNYAEKHSNRGKTWFHHSRDKFLVYILLEAEGAVQCTCCEAVQL